MELEERIRKVTCRTAAVHKRLPDNKEVQVSCKMVSFRCAHTYAVRETTLIYHPATKFSIFLWLLYHSATLHLMRIREKMLNQSVYIPFSLRQLSNTSLWLM